MRLHSIQILTTDSGQSTGGNTKIYIDGKEIKGVTEASYKIEALGEGVLTLKLIGNIEINSISKVEIIEGLK